MIKLIATAAAVALALTGVALGSSGSGRGSDDEVTTARTTTDVTTDDVTTVGVTTTRTETEVENEVEDVSGPCDEAEHRNDPRCTGTVQSTVEASDDHHRRGEGRGRSGCGRGGHSGRG